jgi:hypothetical protein
MPPALPDCLRGRRVAESQAARLTVDLDAGKHKGCHTFDELFDD